MSNNFKSKTINGIAWNSIETFSRNGINFIIGIILARLLSPVEFGIIGMVMIFITISDTFVDSGFRESLIRKKKCTQADYSTVFYFNFAVSVIFYLLLFFTSNYIASFFNEPALGKVLKVVGLVIIFNSFRVIQQTLLEKSMNFKLQAKITFTCSIISGLSGITIGYLGFGVWSLVAKMVLYSLLVSLFFWTFNKWRPSLVFSKTSFDELFSFGSKLLISSMITRIFENIYVFVIARFFSAVTLGFYSQAKKFNQITSHNLNVIVSKVSYPALASVSNNGKQLKRGYKKIIKTVMFISCFMMLFVGVASEAIIVTLLGQKWLQTAEFLSIMCYGAMLYPLQALNLNMLKVKGRSDLFLKVNLVKKIIAIPAICIGIFFGIIPMLYTMLVNSVICYFINSFYSGKLVQYPNREQLNDIFPAFLVTGFSAVAAYSIDLFIDTEYWVMFLLQFSVMSIFTLVIAETVRLEPYLELKVILTEKGGVLYRKFLRVA